jgi:hypothetical protein
MAIKNTRKAVSKTNLDNRLRSKLKENFDWMTEDDEMADDDASLGGGDEDELGGDAGDLGGDLSDEGLSDDTDASADPMADLTQSQEQQLDTEVDELLSANLEDNFDDDTLSEDIADGDDSMDIEEPAEDVMGGTEDGDDDMQITDHIDTTELQSIIDAPNSLGALEDELVNDITSDDDGSTEDLNEYENSEMEYYGDKTGTMDESDDPFKGIKDLPGFDQGYEGKDVKDELTEDVDLADSTEDLGFKEVGEGLNDKITSTVKESVKKSKMLVKAAAAILKLKQIQEAQQKEITKLKFEAAKLNRVNALLAVAGDKMNKEVRKKIVESFAKCKSAKEVNALYGKVVNVIKEHSKPSLNKTIANTKRTQVKTAKSINEGTNRSEAKVDVSKSQMRKNYLMGLDTQEDMYFNNGI